VDSSAATPYSGPLSLQTTCAPATLPGNDDCAGAVAIGDALTQTNNLGATNSYVNSTGCPGYFQDVWFAYKATCTGTLAVSVQTAGNTVLAAWNGANCSFSTLSINQCTGGMPPAPLQVAVVINSVYYISVGAVSTFRGQMNLTTKCTGVGPSTAAPSQPMTAAPSPCPDFTNFLGNCSAENFTDNHKCSSSCQTIAASIFTGLNLTTVQHQTCLLALNASENSTWTPAVAVLSARAAVGQSLCRSSGFRLSLSLIWVMALSLVL